MTFGVTPDGFIPKSEAQVVEELAADQQSTIDPLFEVSPDQPMGQVNAIIARQFAKLWEALGVVATSNDPDKATDDQLTSVCKITGTARLGATFSKVTEACDLVAGTTLQSLVHFVSLDGNDKIRFTPLEDFTAPTTGSHNVVFRAENAGPVSAPSGTLTVIATPVSGWTSASNALSASLGELANNDPRLRERRDAELASGGAGTLAALGADVEKVPGVQKVVTFENKTNATDANGLPPKSFEVLIWDGDPHSADDDEIAQAIWGTPTSGSGKPAGIAPYSSSGDSGTAKDRNGVDQVVPFSRAIERAVYLEYDITTGPGYLGDTDLKAYITEQANGLASLGTFVDVNRLIGLPFAKPGVKNVHSLKVSFSPSPTLSNDLPIGLREIARFDDSRITVV